MTDEQSSALLRTIKECADQAAERGVEVKVDIDDFGFDGHFKATIIATPKKAGDAGAEAAPGLFR